MGCSASNSAMEATASSNGRLPRNSDNIHQEPTAKDLEIDDSPNSSPPNSDYGLRPPMKEVKPPIAFEVTGSDEENGESIIKAHPPKRFVRLEDEQYNLSQDEIERRQALAEQRRTEILQQRIQTARGSRRQMN